LFDATQTKVQNIGGVCLVKVAAWYDNEASYTHQLVRTAEFLATQAKFVK
jgi:glyceraldehyde 3-phosphate dehydrogenase